MTRWTTLAAVSLVLAGCAAAGDSSSGEAGSAMTPSPAANDAGGAIEASPAASNTAGRPVAAATADPAATLAEEGDGCGAAKVKDFIGQEATSEVRGRLAASVGHNRIRWLGPGTAATMDYSPGRLNVSLQADPAREDAGANIITGGRCG